jgi:hypothetical protein
MRLYFAALALFLGCGGTDRVELNLSPDVVSSQSQSLVAKATVFTGSSGIPVLMHVDYTDRNGAPHAITDVTAKTNSAGEVETTFTGFTWEGIGTVTASVLDDKGAPLLDSNKAPITSKATFSVLDLSPPVVSITAPTAGATVGSASQQNQQDFTVTVLATDEIGVSEVFFQAVSGTGANLNLNRTGSRIVGSGSTSISTDFLVGQGGGGGFGGNLQAGATITLTAMASDLSGNIGVAPSVNVILGP